MVSTNNLDYLDIINVKQAGVFSGEFRKRYALHMLQGSLNPQNNTPARLKCPLPHRMRIKKGTGQALLRLIMSHRINGIIK